jgi:Ni/Co efflux regulator RcnB
MRHALASFAFSTLLGLAPLASAQPAAPAKNPAATPAAAPTPAPAPTPAAAPAPAPSAAQVPAGATASAPTAPPRVRFSDAQREVIRAWFRDQRQAATDDDDEAEGAAADTGKGKSKGKDQSKDKGKDQAKGKSDGKSDGKAMPPGMAQRLARGKALPPGIAKTRLPDDLAKKLPPAPAGHEVVLVEGRVVLIETATQIVRDRIGAALRTGRERDEARREAGRTKD